MSNENEQQHPIDPHPVDPPSVDPHPVDPYAGAQPGPADVPPPPYAPPASFAPPAPKNGRMFQLRSVVAIAAAGVVLGGFGGATVSHLVDGSDRGDHGWSERPEPGDGQLPGDGQVPGLPPEGQVPGLPQGDSDDDQSSDGGTTSENG